MSDFVAYLSEEGGCDVSNLISDKSVSCCGLMQSFK